MLKKIILAFGLSLLAGSAFAACSDPLTILNSTSASVNMSVSQNTADAGCMYNITPNQAGGPISATNGWYTNILQGNAVISATNGVFVLPTTSATWAITAASGAFASGSLASGAGTDGWNVTEGAKADAAWVSGSGSIVAINKNIAAGIASIVTNTGAAIPAGTNIIGKVSIDQTTAGTTNGVQVNAALPAGTNTIGTVGQLTYPVGAVPITASATGTTGATTATLAGAVGKTTYICGYSIRGNATAAATNTNTVTGVITATLSSIMWWAPLASGIGIDEQIFSPCIPASATNTGIAIVSGAPGTGGTVSAKGWGYQL